MVASHKCFEIRFVNCQHLVDNLFSGVILEPTGKRSSLGDKEIRIVGRYNKRPVDGGGQPKRFGIGNGKDARDEVDDLIRDMRGFGNLPSRWMIWIRQIR